MRGDVEKVARAPVISHSLRSECSVRHYNLSQKQNLKVQPEYQENKKPGRSHTWTYLTKHSVPDHISSRNHGLYHPRNSPMSIVRSEVEPGIMFKDQVDFSCSFIDFLAFNLDLDRQIENPTELTKEKSQ